MQVLVLTGFLLVSLVTLSLGILLSQKKDVSPRKESALSPTVTYDLAVTVTPTHTPKPTATSRAKLGPTVTFLPVDTSAPTPKFTPTIGPSKLPATATPTPTSKLAQSNSGEVPVISNQGTGANQSNTSAPSSLAVILIIAGGLMSAISLLLLMLAIRRRSQNGEN